jgi:hypothetical protein
MEKNLLVDVQMVKLQLKGKEKNLTIESSNARGCFSLGAAGKWQIAKPRQVANRETHFRSHTQDSEGYVLLSI